MFLLFGIMEQHRERTLTLARISFAPSMLGMFRSRGTKTTTAKKRLLGALTPLVHMMCVRLVLVWSCSKLMDI